MTEVLLLWLVPLAVVVLVLWKGFERIVELREEDRADQRRAWRIRAEELRKGERS